VSLSPTTIATVASDTAKPVAQREMRILMTLPPVVPTPMARLQKPEVEAAAAGFAPRPQD
jgi:hypothetical protein